MLLTLLKALAAKALLLSVIQSCSNSIESALKQSNADWSCSEDRHMRIFSFTGSVSFKPNWLCWASFSSHILYGQITVGHVTSKQPWRGVCSVRVRARGALQDRHRTLGQVVPLWWSWHYFVLHPSWLWSLPDGWFKSPSTRQGIEGWKKWIWKWGESRK